MGWRTGRQVGWTARRLVIAASCAVGGLVAACAPPAEPFVRFPVGSGPSPVQPAAAALAGPVRIVGRDLVDAEGRVVLLHGMNLVAKSAPYYPRLGVDLDDGDFAYLRDNGFNAVRLGVWYRELLPAPGVVDGAYLDHVAEVVDALAAHHLYVLLDFHQDVFTGLPDWATTPEAASLSDEPPAWSSFIGWAAGYLSPRSMRQWDDLWADRPTAVDPTRSIFSALGDGAVAMAERFAGEPAVIGMELMNEPFAGSGVIDCLAAGCAGLEAMMAQRWQAMTDRVHAAVPSFNVFWSPQALAPHYADTALPAPATPPAGERNVGLTFHTYCYGTDGGSLEPASDVDRGRCQAMFGASLRRGDAAAARWDAPMLLTEFGASNNPLDATLAARVADEYRTSWFYWHLRFHLPEEVESQIVRPTPQATAGTPLALRFEPATGAFEYRYEPDGAVGAPTVVVVPRRQYPDGYTVAVTGGSVTSAPNAGLVTIEADGTGAEVVVGIDRRPAV